MNKNLLMFLPIATASMVFAQTTEVMDQEAVNKIKARWREINNRQYMARLENKKLQEREALYNELIEKTEKREREIKKLKAHIEFLRHRVVRNWTSASGKQIAARLVRDNSVEVILQTVDGKKMTAPVEYLSEADRQYLSVLRGKVSATSVDPYEELLRKTTQPSTKPAEPRDKSKNFLDGAMQKAL